MKYALLMMALLSDLTGLHVDGFVNPLIMQPKTATTTTTRHDRVTKVTKGSDFRSFASNDSEDMSISSLERRNLFHCLELSIAAAASAVMFPKSASAELIQFPCKEGKLRNTYHFMRAGESELENENMLGTNPMFLTNRVDNSLSDLGISQVEEACNIMNQAQLDLSIVKFPLAANAMDTADKVASKLFIGRNHLVPEYTYMDQRGVGKWDMQPLQSTQDAVWAMDAKEAGTHGLAGGLPPPNDDGTANEMLGHQVIRLRQLLSLLESFASGDSILLIFPDGTGPALLSCLIAGIPLHRVHELDFRPGEVRLDITPKSVSALLSTGPSSEYLEAIQRGGTQLKALRKNPQELVSVRDQAYADELRLEGEQEAARKEATLKRQQAAQEEQEAARREVELKRQQAVEVEQELKLKRQQAVEEEQELKLKRHQVALEEQRAKLKRQQAAQAERNHQYKQYSGKEPTGIEFGMIEEKRAKLKQQQAALEERNHQYKQAREQQVKEETSETDSGKEPTGIEYGMFAMAAGVLSLSPSPEKTIAANTTEGIKEQVTGDKPPDDSMSSAEPKLEEELPVYKELERMEELAESAPISVPEFSEEPVSMPHIANHTLVSSSGPSEEDPMSRLEETIAANTTEVIKEQVTGQEKLPDDSMSNAEPKLEEELPVYKELEKMEVLAESAPILVPEFSEEPVSIPHIADGTFVSSSGPSEEDPMQVAEKAMEEYMSQDDGGDSFRSLLEELMND